MVCHGIILTHQCEFRAYQVTSKSFKFPEQHKLPFFFVSAADGTNVVKVFEQAVEEAVRHRNKVCKILSSVSYYVFPQLLLCEWVPRRNMRVAFSLIGFVSTPFLFLLPRRENNRGELEHELGSD